MVCAKKLSGRSAKSEVPDTVAPTHSTASRGQFATLGESSRYFNHPKTIQYPKTQNLCHTRAGCAYIASHRTALRAVPRLRCERVSPIRSIAHRRGFQLRNPCGDTCAPRRSAIKRYSLSRANPGTRRRWRYCVTALVVVILFGDRLQYPNMLFALHQQRYPSPPSELGAW